MYMKSHEKNNKIKCPKFEVERVLAKIVPKVALLALSMRQ